MNTDYKTIITNFIEEIWNLNQYERIGMYLHHEYISHSLPPVLPANREGLKRWIEDTGQAFEHKTIIEAMVSEENKVMVKIKMLMKHIGTWREIMPTDAEVYAVGYRYYILQDGKIIEDWALIDGNAIENQLKEVNNGCKIQE